MTDKTGEPKGDKCDCQRERVACEHPDECSGDYPTHRCPPPALTRTAPCPGCHARTRTRTRVEKGIAGTILAPTGSMLNAPSPTTPIPTVGVMVPCG